MKNDQEKITQKNNVLCAKHKIPFTEQLGFCEDCLIEAHQANLANFGSYNPEINELEQKLERLKNLLKSLM